MTISAGSLLGSRALVTGHTGFKGAWLSATLKKFGADVFGLSLMPERGGIFEALTPVENKKSHIVDIRNRKKVRAVIQNIKPDFVFHLAAQPLVAKSFVKPYDTFETNVMGTINLLQSVFEILGSQTPCLVVTTDKVYRTMEGEIQQPHVENDYLYGKDPYSLSKVSAETVVSAWRSIGMERVVSARSGNVIGGGDTSVGRLMPDILRNVFENAELILRHPEATRPWQHVLDPIYGYVLYMRRIISKESFPTALNFGPDPLSITSVTQVLSFVEEILNKPINFTTSNNSKFIETTNLTLDSSLASATLGWKNALTLKEAIEWTLVWESEKRNGSSHRCTDQQISNYFERIG